MVSRYKDSDGKDAISAVKVTNIGYASEEFKRRLDEKIEREQNDAAGDHE